MKAIIEKMESGHLIIIEDGDERKKFAVGKWHAVVTCLRENFAKQESWTSKNKKSKVKIK